MTKNFKILNESNQILQQEKLSLQKKISDLEKEIINLKISNVHQQAGTIEPNKSIASPAQTEAGKDLSNPFMVLGLPKAQQTQEAVDPLTFNQNQTQQAEKPVTRNSNSEDQTQQTDNSATRLISPIDLKQKSSINFEDSSQFSQDPDQLSQTDIKKIQEMLKRLKNFSNKLNKVLQEERKFKLKRIRERRKLRSKMMIQNTIIQMKELMEENH